MFPGRILYTLRVSVQEWVQLRTIRVGHCEHPFRPLVRQKLQGNGMIKSLDSQATPKSMHNKCIYADGHYITVITLIVYREISPARTISLVLGHRKKIERQE